MRMKRRSLPPVVISGTATFLRLLYVWKQNVFLLLSYRVTMETPLQTSGGVASIGGQVDRQTLMFFRPIKTF